MQTPSNVEGQPPSHGLSGAVRRFAGWVARGSVGYPLTEGVDYWDALQESPSQMETMFAVFINNLRLDEAGEPTNEKYAEGRAACFIHSYCTGKEAPGQPPIEAWEVELY